MLIRLFWFYANYDPVLSQIFPISFSGIMSPADQNQMLHNGSGSSYISCSADQVPQIYNIMLN